MLILLFFFFFFFFSSRRRHTRWHCDWSSDVCSSDLVAFGGARLQPHLPGQSGHVQLMEQVADVLVAGGATVLLLAPGELPGEQRHVVGLRPVGRGVDRKSVV